MSTTRVLVVEDDEDLQTVLSFALKKIDAQMQIDWFTSAEDALEKLKAGMSDPSLPKYNLVVADIFLSKAKTGVDLWLACEKTRPKIDFLLISGMDLGDFFKLVGNNVLPPPYLGKPFSPDRFREVVSALLNKRPQS